MRAKVLASIVDEEHRKWWTLAAVSFGLFMIMLDNTIVNVALPTIQRSLDLKISELEWVVTGYALTFGAFMLTGGKLADLMGRRRIFVIGLIVFTGSSLACGLAGGATVLIAARVIQGLGAALMNPATLSIIVATFPARQRGTAIGVWAGVSALALAIGPLVGGIITERISWNWIFFINIPVGVLGIVAAYLFIDESRDTSREQRPDVPGLVTSTVGLFALIYGLIEANNYGWTSPRILISFGIAAAALVAVPSARALPAPADARAGALPQQGLLWSERRDAADRTRDVRRLLLRLAVRPAGARLLGDPGRGLVPALDGPDHPARAAGRPPVRPDRAEAARGAAG